MVSFNALLVIALAAVAQAGPVLRRGEGYEVAPPAYVEESAAPTPYPTAPAYPSSEAAAPYPTEPTYPEEELEAGEYYTYSTKEICSTYVDEAGNSYPTTYYETISYVATSDCALPTATGYVHGEYPQDYEHDDEYEHSYPSAPYHGDDSSPPYPSAPAHGYEGASPEAPAPGYDHASPEAPVDAYVPHGGDETSPVVPAKDYEHEDCGVVVVTEIYTHTVTEGAHGYPAVPAPTGHSYGPDSTSPEAPYVPHGEYPTDASPEAPYEHGDAPHGDHYYPGDESPAYPEDEHHYDEESPEGPYEHSSATETPCSTGYSDSAAPTPYPTGAAPYPTDETEGTEPYPTTPVYEEEDASPEEPIYSSTPAGEYPAETDAPVEEYDGTTSYEEPAPAVVYE